MDSFIRERVEQQIKERMKDDRLVAAEVTDKVLRNIRYSFLPLLACFALLGWLGYSNLKDASAPLLQKAEVQAKQAVGRSQKALDEASAAKASMEQTKIGLDDDARRLRTFGVTARKELSQAQAQLERMRTLINASSFNVNAKLRRVENAAELLDARLKLRTAQLHEYEARVDNLSTQVAQLSAKQQFPGLGDESAAYVGTRRVDGREKKPGEKFVIFDYTQWAVNADMMTPQQIAEFEQSLAKEKIMVFNGAPAFGKTSGSRFQVTPFEPGHFNNGVWIEYFSAGAKHTADEVCTQLAKYLRISPGQPEVVSAQSLHANSNAEKFVKASRADVYVQVFPTH